MSKYILQREINLYSKFPFIPYFVLYKEVPVTRYDAKKNKHVNVKGKYQWAHQGSGGIIWAYTVGRHYGKPVNFHVYEAHDLQYNY